MKFSNVRLLVQDFKKCFKFYTETLEFVPVWGDENGCYASFKVAEGIEGFAIFLSDFMAPAVGNADKTQPFGYREKSLVSFEVDNVDETFQAFVQKGIHFLNQPTDMADWGMRVVHLRDPEENLIEFFTPLKMFCQSCGMPMNEDKLKGSNIDDTLSNDYCSFCFQKGNLTNNVSLDEQVEMGLPYFPPYINAKTTEEKDRIKQQSKEFLSSLKRWKS